MLILHDNGKIIGVQTFPPTSHLPHIVVDDKLFDDLKDASFTLDFVDNKYVLPKNYKQYSKQAQLTLAKEAKKEEILAASALEHELGYEYDFSGSIDIVQIRNAQDIANIITLSNQASLIKSQKMTATISFRAKSNEVYSLSADDALKLSVNVLVYVESLRLKLWTLKDQIYNSKTIDELSKIQW